MLRALPRTSVKFGCEYVDVAFVMSRTGLDTNDVLRLRCSSFADGMIRGRRGKTGKPFSIVMSPELADLFTRRSLEKTGQPDAEDSPLFRVPCADTVSQQIGRAFDLAGLPQFHAKSLRDFVGSNLFNNGFNDAQVQDFLGQKRGSMETQKYTKPSLDLKKRIAGALDPSGKREEI